MPAPRNCSGCPLSRERLNVVNGHGPAHASLLFVGQAPGENEDKQCRNFVGEAGRVIKTYARAVGIDPDEAYWCNACRCRPPGNRSPTARELTACRPYLLEDIRRVKPNLVVSLGREALITLMGAKAGITRMRGHILQQPDTSTKLLPTFHPIAAGHDWGKEPDILADLAKAKAEMRTPNMPIGETDVVSLTTVDAVRWLRDWLLELAPSLDYLSLDLETTGLDYLNDEILCVGFTPVRGKDFWGIGYSIPILGQYAVDFWGDQLQEVINLLQEIFGGPFEYAGQNFKFDQKFLERSHDYTSGLQPNVVTAYGFQVARRADGSTALGFDTMLGYHLLHEEQPHNLEHQQSLFTTMPYYADEISSQSAGKTKMAEADPKVTWQYQGADTDCTGRLAIVHRKALAVDPRQEWLYENIAAPLHDFTRRVEERGILLDRPRFDALCKKYADLIAKAELDVFRHHRPFNYNSPKQMQTVLFRDLKLPKPGVKTKGAKGCVDCRAGYCEKHDSTGVEALQAIQKMRKHPILDDLIVLKKLAKLKGTYLDGTGGKRRGLLESIAIDGRIHTVYRIPGCVTGRLSSSPNLQNIPTLKEFRMLFMAPPGCVFLEADWSQLELRIMAYIAEDPTLLALLNSGADLHTYVARKLWPTVDPSLPDAEWAVQHSDLRTRAKGFNFGLDYGLTAYTVARRFNMSEQEAEAKIAMYMRLFPGLPRYFAMCRRLLMETGGAENIFGRQRRYYGLRTFKNTRSYRYQIGEIQRQCYNFPIQSSGSDIHSIASVRVDTDDWLLEMLPCADSEHARAVTVLSVHDSVGMEAVATHGLDDPELIETARHIQAEMQEIPQKLLGWNLPVEIKWGPSWGKFERKLNADGEVEDLTKLAKAA